MRLWATMSHVTRVGISCTVAIASSFFVQWTLTHFSPRTMSPAAAVQYLLDIRHTTVGARWASRSSPPLQTGELRGKVVLITGGTAGIGFASARYLAEAGAEVHVTGRNRERGNSAATASNALDGQIIFHKADLGSITGARAFAETLMAGALQGRHIDILIQNLAVMHGDHRRDADGNELTLATNLFNFYLLARMLTPHLASGARMINVVSAGQHLFRLRLEDLLELNAPEAANARFDGIRAYSLTHRARVLLSERWAQSPAFGGVAIASVHPGWVETAGLREATPMAAWYAAMKYFLRDEDEGADTVAWLASSSVPLESDSLNGGYFWNRQRRSIDLPFAGTASGEDELDRIISWLDQMVTI